MAIPPWAWVLIGLLILLIGAWSTNVACPAFGRSCSKANQSGAGGSGAYPTSLSADQLKLIESYF